MSPSGRSVSGCGASWIILNATPIQAIRVKDAACHPLDGA